MADEKKAALSEACDLCEQDPCKCDELLQLTGPPEEDAQRPLSESQEGQMRYRVDEGYSLDFLEAKELFATLDAARAELAAATARAEGAERKLDEVKGRFFDADIERDAAQRELAERVKEVESLAGQLATRQREAAKYRAALYALEDLASQLNSNEVHLGNCKDFGARIWRHLDSIRAALAGDGDAGGDT